MKKIKRRVVKKAFYSDEEDESDEEEIEISRRRLRATLDLMGT